MLKFVLPLLALISAPALAGEATNSVRVSIADLDLSTVAGQATMKSRVRGAVRTLCPAKHLVSVAQIYGTRRCAKAARASAKAPMLLAIAKAEREQANGGITVAVR